MARTGAAARASASAKGAAAAVAALSGVTGGASTRVRGIIRHMEASGSGGTDSSESATGTTFFLRLNQPKSPPSNVVLGSASFASASRALRSANSRSC